MWLILFKKERISVGGSAMVFTDLQARAIQMTCTFSKQVSSTLLESVRQYECGNSRYIHKENN